MSLNFLDFEQPIAELEAKIDSLTAVSRQDENWILTSTKKCIVCAKSVELTRKIFADLGAWQIAQLARHPQRPYTWIMSARRLTNLTNWQATAHTLTIKLSSAVSRVWMDVR